jgi:uncharacterized protein YkwD
MKKHFLYKYKLFLSIFLFCGSLTACSSGSDSPAINYSVTSPAPTVSQNNESTSESTSNSSEYTKDQSNDSSQITKTPVLKNTLQKYESIKVRNNTIRIGENTDSLLEKLGTPHRIDSTEYKFDYYIYNNDYKRLLFVAVSNGKVVGFYTDSLDFNYEGIQSGSTLATVNKTLASNYSMKDVLSKKAGQYTIKIFFDKTVTQKVTGVLVLPKKFKINNYSKTVVHNVSLQVYDLTNSIRMRNQVPVLSWSSSASQSARKHSVDMAENGFFGHINPKRESYSDRLRAEGIYIQKSNENLIAGYGTAIISVHKLFNSKAQRKIMLNPAYRYLGAGFDYLAESTYQTYITQNFYR